MSAHESAKEQKSNEAKARMTVEMQAALELHEAAMKGTVRRNLLTDISKLDGSTLREQQGQHREK